jgi:hypothetical protein
MNTLKTLDITIVQNSRVVTWRDIGAGPAGICRVTDSAISGGGCQATASRPNRSARPWRTLPVFARLARLAVAVPR